MNKQHKVTTAEWRALSQLGQACTVKNCLNKPAEYSLKCRQHVHEASLNAK